MIDTSARLSTYPFALKSELREAANEHGYRIGPEEAAGWLFFRSATAPGEIALAATDGGMAGPFFLSVAHPGATSELHATAAGPCCKSHAGAFAFADRDALHAGVSAVYRLSMSLPTLPYEAFKQETRHLGDTEIERIQRVRIGQSCFRDALLTYWSGACPTTGITDPNLLRASHIVPWAQCESDRERLNVHNGLLLSSLWDAAFDAGLVTFDDEGFPLVSPKLSEAAAVALRIRDTAPIPLTPEHRSRLAWHRSNLWQGC